MRGRRGRRWAAALALLAAASFAPAAPRRVASLNLCTDELVLLLAAPGQIVSVTHLSRDPAETPLWRAARHTRPNDGTILSVAALRPDLIVTTGGAGSDGARIAHALGARLLVLPFPATLDDVTAAIRQVAAALGRRPQGAALAARLAALRASAPPMRRDAIFLSGGGRTMDADGLGAQWLALAGLTERAMPGGRADMETLLVHPPIVLLASDYRANALSRERAWFAQPALARVRAGRRIVTEGRRWTCLGPALIPEILRLRARLR